MSEEKVLSAEQVKKLPVGTHVQWHAVDRDGMHTWTNCVVVAAGHRRVLALGAGWNRETRAIKALPDHWFTLQ